MKTYHPCYADNIRRPDHERVRDALVETLIGDHVASGEYRDVYECPINENLVIKIEHNRLHFHSANNREHNNWLAAKNADAIFEMDGQPHRICDWLLPVRHISSCGRVLLQDRGERAATIKDMPAMIPSFLTDIKQDNWILYKNRVVVCDYADVFFSDTHMVNWDGKMKKICLPESS